METNHYQISILDKSREFVFRFSINNYQFKLYVYHFMMIFLNYTFSHTYSSLKLVGTKMVWCKCIVKISYPKQVGL